MGGTPVLILLYVASAVSQSPTPLPVQWVVAQEFDWERFADTQSTACRYTSDLSDSGGPYSLHSAASLDDCKAACPATDCGIEFSVDPMETTGYRCETWIPATDYYAIVSHQSQCWTKSRTQKSCDTVCSNLGKVCAQSELDALSVPNNEALLLAAFADVGATCQSVSRGCESGNNCEDWGAPYLHSNQPVCFGGSSAASCSQVPLDFHHRRVCPCAEDPNACAGAGAAEWGQCGGIGWQQEQWCDGETIECVPQVNNGVLNEYYYQCLACTGDCCACGELRMNGICIPRSALEGTTATSTSAVAITTALEGTTTPSTSAVATTTAMEGTSPLSTSAVPTTFTSLPLSTTPAPTATSSAPALFPLEIDSDSKARLFIANIELQMSNVTTGRESLETAVGKFFSVNQVSANLSVNNLTNIQASIDVALVLDRDLFVSRIEETSRLLENYLQFFSSLRRLLVAQGGYKVLNITATCGAGFTLSSSECVACGRNMFKSQADNSECVACPTMHFTKQTGADSADLCECREGYTKVAVGEDHECVNSIQYVSVEAAENAAAGISAAVGSVVATNVAVAVATAVASSVSSAIAASSGGAVGGAMGVGVGGGGGGAVSGSGSAGSGSSGTLTLITHVQVLNQMGRIGGGRSNSVQKFSDGFRWSNFDLGLSIGTQSRRAAKQGTAHQGGLTADGSGREEDDLGTCSLEDIAPPLERLITCALAISGVFFARNLTILVIQKCIRSDKTPQHLVFPAWEGPVILVQYLAICDLAFGAASLLCPSGVLFGILILLMGPLAFLFVAVRFVSRHVTAGELSFEYSDRPSFADLKKQLSSAKGVVAKVVTANAWYEGALARGSWEDSKASVWWGFLISDVVGSSWIFSAWLLVKKLWLTLVLNSFDGLANVVLAIIAQVVDTGALLYLRPFVDRKIDITEIVGGLLNLLAFIAISLPTILGPDVPVPEFLGAYTTMILATLATALAAVVSIMSPLATFVRLIFKACCFIASACGWFKSPNLVTAGYQASKADIMAGVKGEVQAYVEEAYIPTEEAGRETAAIPAAGATCLQTVSVDRDLAVEIEIILAVEWDDKNEELEQGVSRDVASSVDGDPFKARVLSLQKGSVCVHMAIDEGICGQERSAFEAAIEIKRQASDPKSRLMQGRFTQHTTAVTILRGIDGLPMLPMVKDTLETPTLITCYSFSSKAGTGGLRAMKGGGGGGREADEGDSAEGGGEAGAAGVGGGLRWMEGAGGGGQSDEGEGNPVECVVSPSPMPPGMRQVMWNKKTPSISTRTMEGYSAQVLKALPLDYVSGGTPPPVNSDFTDLLTPPPPRGLITPLPSSSPPSFKWSNKKNAREPFSWVRWERDELMDIGDNERDVYE